MPSAYKVDMSEQESTETSDFDAFASLDSLELEDTITIPVRTADDKIIRFSEQENPWRVTLNRFSVAHTFESFKKHSTDHDKGFITNDEFSCKILELIVAGWENGPEPFSKSILRKLALNNKYRWFVKQVTDTSMSDRHFTKGT